jgi:S-DNA-T family DNA segregation ATPase FtsK/SpoIIIE
MPKKYEKTEELLKNILIELKKISSYYEKQKKQDEKKFLSNDELYNKAKKIITKYKQVSASLLQRKLEIGYARSAYLLDLLEKNKLVSQANGAEPRKVLKKEYDKKN